MTKEEALQAIKLLSALESWAFSVSNSKGSPVPDYLHDHLHEAMEVLERIVLAARRLRWRAASLIPMNSASLANAQSVRRNIVVGRRLTKNSRSTCGVNNEHQRRHECNR